MNIRALKLEIAAQVEWKQKKNELDNYVKHRSYLRVFLWAISDPSALRGVNTSWTGEGGGPATYINGTVLCPSFLYLFWNKYVDTVNLHPNDKFQASLSQVFAFWRILRETELIPNPGSIHMPIWFKMPLSFLYYLPCFFSLSRSSLFELLILTPIHVIYIARTLLYT